MSEPVNAFEHAVGLVYQEACLRLVDDLRRGQSVMPSQSTWFLLTSALEAAWPEHIVAYKERIGVR